MLDFLWTAELLLKQQDDKLCQYQYLIKPIVNQKNQLYQYQNIGIHLDDLI